VIDVALGDYEKTTYVNGQAPGISAQNLNRNENKTEELDTAVKTHGENTTIHITSEERTAWNAQATKAEFDAHLADYTLQVPYGATTGLANTYAVSLTPAPTSYVAGMALAVKINVDSTGASTINVNSLGAKTIKKANGTDVTNLKNGGIYTLRYDGTNFILQGEGGSGNAVASDLLSGKTASTDAGDITGTMVNRGTFSLGLGVSVPAGYYSGGTTQDGAIFQIGTNLNISAEANSTVTVNTSFIPKLIVLRVYVNGNWGSAAFTNLTYSNVWRGIYSTGLIHGVSVYETSGNSFTIRNISGYAVMVDKYFACNQKW